MWLHHPGGSLSIYSRRVLTDPNRIDGEFYERGKPALDVAHRRVFIGSADHGLYALSAQDLNVLWRFETRGPVQAEPLYAPDEDAVYFGSTDGSLYKVKARDGALEWRFNSNGEVAKAPIIDGDTLYCTNANDTLIAINKATGKLKWHQHRTPAFGIQIGGYAGPALSHAPGFDGRIYTAFSDGTAMAYSTADGSEQWPVVDLAMATPGATEGQPPQYLDVDTTPVLANIKQGPAVMLASYEAGVFALDASGGHELWHNVDVRGVSDLLLWDQEVPIDDAGTGHITPGQVKRAAGRPIKSRRVLIAASGSTGLWGLDPDTGEQLWRKKVPEGGISAPVSVEGAVLLSTTRYGIFLFSPIDGSVLDGIAPGNEISMTPAVHGSKAFVMTNGGEMMALLVAPPR